MRRTDENARRSDSPGRGSALFSALTAAFLADQATTEVVVIDAEKSGGQLADRFLINDQGALLAARGPQSPPEALWTHLRPLSDRPRPYVVSGLSYLPYLKRCRLIIVGAGHVGQKTAELAADVDFDVWVVDDREEYCNPDRFPRAKRLLVGPIDQVLSGLGVDSDTYCIIVTGRAGTIMMKRRSTISRRLRPAMSDSSAVVVRLN
ncbi:MAG: XdhC family protein [Planctomycetaceae bacterium]